MQSVLKWETNKETYHVSQSHFLTLGSFTQKDIHFLLEDAIKLKKYQKEGIPHSFLQGKVLAMLFEKASTRTRVSFEVAMLQLGGHAIFLSSNDIQLGRGESPADTAKVLSRYVDGLMIRTFDHQTLEEFALHSNVPIINGLTDSHHPAQVLADLLTIKEHKGKLKGLKLCYLGDANNNMSHSLIEGTVKVGMHISIACPNGFEPDPTILNAMKKEALITGSSIQVGKCPVELIKNADVVVTDVWTSMGQESETEERLKVFAPYQVNSELCKYAKDDFIFLHCLPAHRGEEVTAEIIDGTHSVVFDEAENRLHAQKAILKALLGN
ncbi:ornithine carbamoyltransferase [Bacillus sp. CHD6a]|uniref:ornithine carbamoyltransferase n=1 Tax=Bacillus sp. CHD6a TaxID=1643452 RepID=UPI0006CDBBB5|nr:ornithine carbamoyltransferase [Bacillus sp. CHD6a]KPB06460.1 ornithine carbamoyltransferase [Bacillus sp. CHD6a]